MPQFLKSKVVIVVNALLGGVIITLISMVVSFLITLFEGGEDGVRYAFFKSIFLKSESTAGGATELSFGFTKHFLPIIEYFLVMTVILLVFQMICRLLFVRRERLLKDESE